MGNNPKDPRIGTVLQGRYRIIDQIATGAMGSIYRGARLKLGRTVAIKFLDASFTASSDELLQRFSREATAMSRLTHPHCVSVIDFGVAEGTPYIVMEHVSGTTLLQLIEWGRVAPGRAIRIIRQVLAGLAHAHRQEVIHRDIKPANIMLTEATGTGDHARILDFGLAKLLDIRPSDPRDLSTSRVVLGTPSYMSPEQAQGKPVDARTDIYSVGIVLFELLTNKRPFIGADGLETLRMHQEDKPPYLADLCPEGDFSAELESVIARALAKIPDKRFASAIDFADALDAVPEAAAPAPYRDSDAAADRTAAVRSPAASRRHTRLAGLALAVATLGLVIWYLWPRPEPRSSARTPTHPPSATSATSATAAPAPATDDRQAAADPALGDDAGVDAAAAAADATVPTDSAPPDATTTPDAAAAVPTTPPRTAARGRTIADAEKLLDRGKKAEALTLLRRLARKSPKNAYLHMLIGKLYFDKRWTSHGLEAYQRAIANNPAYRKSSRIIRSAIDCLESPKVYGKATTLLRSVGKPALPHLEKAAARHRSKTVRKRASALVTKIKKKKR